MLGFFPPLEDTELKVKQKTDTQKCVSKFWGVLFVKM